MKSSSKSKIVFELVQRRCPAGVQDWLELILSRLESPIDSNLFGAAYAGARRRLGSAPTALDGAEEATLENAGLTAINGRALDEVLRIALLIRVCECLPAEEHPPFIGEVYLRGDSHERQALLRSLVFLPGPERFIDTAVEACRTNVQLIFEAIACDNNYPQSYFPELNFNQMVLKALFIESPLSRVLGLEERITSELVRMAEDYAAERRSAGRSVPEDIALINKKFGGNYEAI